MTDQASTPAPNVAVEVVARPPHTCFLVVHYDGLAPPTGLFADLQMIGWTPPVLAPPPRAAIDWATPNEATGESFTVRNWRVEGAIVEPPPGSGPRGSWNPHEGDAFLRSLRGVLQRHDVTPVDADGRLRDTALPPPPPTASAPAGAPPPPSDAAPTFPKRRGSLRSLSGRLRDAAADSSAARAAAGHGDDASVELLSLVLSIPDDGRLAIRAIAAPARFPAIEDGLRALDVDVWFTAEDHEERQTFRGSSVSTTVMKFKVTALAPSGVAADAVHVFEEHGARFEVEVLDAAAAQALAAAAAAERGETEAEGDEDDFALIRRRYPCAHLVVEPARAEAVIDMIHRLGLQHAQKRPSELESVGVFRGSRNVTRKPAVAFDVWAPPAHATRVLGELAAVGGVDPDRQPDQAWISPPEPAADPEELVVAEVGDRPASTGDGDFASSATAEAPDPKAPREIASDGDAEPLDIDRDLAGLIDEAPQLAHVTQR